VIHGTADPMFPIAHGEALAEEILDEVACAGGPTASIGPTGRRSPILECLTRTVAASVPQRCGLWGMEEPARAVSGPAFVLASCSAIAGAIPSISFGVLATGARAAAHRAS
jgi:hypothetical protein